MASASDYLEIAMNSPSNDIDDLEGMLRVMGVKHHARVLKRLNDYDIDGRALKNLKDYDIQQMFPNEVRDRVDLRMGLMKLSTDVQIPVVTQDPAEPKKRLIGIPALESVLNHSAIGQNILCERGQVIEDRTRSRLMDQIVRFYVHQSVAFSVQHAEFYAKEIVRVFPHEVKEYYFEGRQTKKGHVKSKLYNKYRNLSQSMKSRVKDPVHENDPDGPNDEAHGLDSNKAQDTADKAGDETDETDSDENSEDTDNAATEIGENALEKKAFLRCERDDWEKIMRVWKETAKQRSEDYKTLSVKDINEMWPLFKHPLAPKLIDIDFEYIHPHKQNSLYSCWELFEAKIPKIYDQKIKDRACKKDLQIIQSTENKNMKDYLLIKLLHGALSPRICKSGSNESGKAKYSIVHSQASQFFINTSATAIPRELERRRDFALRNNLKVCPFIIVEENFEKFFIYCEDNYYEASSPVRALDIAFKLFQVLNLEYPIESTLVWMFIENFFYKIHNNTDGTIQTLINDITRS